MSIQPKLDQIKRIKQNIKTSIQNKNIDMTGVKFAQYPQKIDQIKSGGIITVNGSSGPDVIISVNGQTTTNINLTSEDVGALSVSGGTIEGNLNVTGSLTSNNYTSTKTLILTDGAQGKYLKVLQGGTVGYSDAGTSTIEKIKVNSVQQPIIDKTVDLQVISNPQNPQVGHFLQKTANGWTTSPGIATVQQKITSVYDNKIKVNNTSIPVMLKTSKGNIYPIEKNVLTQSGNYFYIDINPYLIYDNVPSFSGQWTVYFGAGVSQRNTNTVYNGTVYGGTYNLDYTLGDIHNISTNTDTIIFATNIPIGQGATIRINNTENSKITFQNLQIINSTGKWIVPFGNIVGTIQLIGGAIPLDYQKTSYQQQISQLTQRADNLTSLFNTLLQQ